LVNIIPSLPDIQNQTLLTLKRADHKLSRIFGITSSNFDLWSIL